MSLNPPSPGRIPPCRAIAASTGLPCQTPAQHSRNRNYCLWHGRGAPDEFIQADDPSTGLPIPTPPHPSQTSRPLTPHLPELPATHPNHPASGDDPFAFAAPDSSPPDAPAAPSLIVRLAIPTGDTTTAADGGGGNDRKRKRGNAGGRRVRFELNEDEEEDVDNGGGGGGGDTEAAQGEAAGQDEKESLVVRLQVRVGE